MSLEPATMARISLKRSLMAPCPPAPLPPRDSPSFALSLLAPSCPARLREVVQEEKEKNKVDKNMPMPEEERTMINQGGLAVAALPATVGALFMLWCVRLPRPSLAALTLAEVARAPVNSACRTDASDTRHVLAGAWAASWVGFKPSPPHAPLLSRMFYFNEFRL